MLAGIGAIVLLCALIYFPRLGDDGYASSEGQRAIPAWAMLETGDWLVPRLFEIPYVRKPPGIFWAIAASGMVFGESEFAARLPSAIGATLLALITAFVVSRWHGSRWGMVAGATMALMPWIWPSARSAEIESLLTLFVGAACLIVVDLGVRPSAGRSFPIARATMLAAAVTGAVYMKGPAMLPPVLAAAIAIALTADNSRRAVITSTLLACVVAAAAFLPWALLTYGRVSESEFIAQSPTAFFDKRILKWLGFVPTTLVTSLPWSLFPIVLLAGPSGADARTPADRQAFLAAKTCAIAWAITIVMFIPTGNPRYALPSVVFLPPIVAWALRGVNAGFSSRRARVAAHLSLGGSYSLHALSALAALGYVFLVQSGLGVHVGLWFVKSRESLSGRATGIEFSRMIHDGDLLYADNLIDARPETLYYALQEAAKEGRSARAVWSPLFRGVPEEGAGKCLVVRTDEESREIGNAIDRSIPGFDLGSPEGEWTVHKYTFVLFRAGDADTDH